MNCCTRAILGALGGGALVGGLSAGFNAAAGAIGGAIFKASRYPDYDPTEAAKMGAIGGAILGGSVGVMVGAAVGAVSSLANGNVNLEVKLNAQSGLSYLAGSVVTGLVGYGVMNAGARETVMNAGETALSFLVGGAISSVGAIPAFICCALPLAAMAFVAMSDKTPTELAAPDLENPAPVTTPMRPR